MALSAENLIVAADAVDPETATRLWAVKPGEALPKGAGILARRAGFSGQCGEVLAFDDGVVVGLGGDGDPLALGAAAARLPSGMYLPETDLSDVDLMAWALGRYRFDAYIAAQDPATLIAPAGADLTTVYRDIRAAFLARDLVNTPTEDMGPAELEAAVRAVGAPFGAEVEVIDGTDLTEGYPLIDAVGRAAATPPRLIDLRWGEPGDRTLTLVGKGVCFDSGGLNIKGGKGMALMKKDMGGAANALALAQTIMAAGLRYRLRLLIPAVENAIAGNAFRPGDVFRSRSGQTVEISNTDAEGRLVLADALSLAAEEKPDHIITMATLTGAARVALGPDVAPVYSTDESFAAKVVAAGQAAADPVWPMPMWSAYNRYLTSSIADVNHASPNSFAGSITAALFLKRFVPDGVRYTHFDIYAWVPAARPGRPLGGEAMAIRALYGALTSAG